MNLLDPTILNNKILNLEKVLQLNEHSQKTITDLWSSLLWQSSYYDPAGINKNHIQWNPYSFTCYYNTLNDWGYINQKIEND